MALAVTVYGGGLALVSDERVAMLAKRAPTSLAFEGVSNQVIPSSAWLVGNESGHCPGKSTMTSTS